LRERAQEKEANEYSRRLQRKDVYDTLFAKVQAIQQLNLQPEKWNQSQLKIMVRWFRRDGDEKMPSKKTEQLERYYATCQHGKLQAPGIPELCGGPGTVGNEQPSLDEELPQLNLLPDEEELNLLPDEDRKRCSDDEQELATLLAGGFRRQQEKVTDTPAAVEA